MRGAHTRHTQTHSPKWDSATLGSSLRLHIVCTTMLCWRFMTSHYFTRFHHAFCTSRIFKSGKQCLTWLLASIYRITVDEIPNTSASPPASRSGTHRAVPRAHAKVPRVGVRGSGPSAIQDDISLTYSKCFFARIAPEFWCFCWKNLYILRQVPLLRVLHPMPMAQAFRPRKSDKSSFEWVATPDGNAIEMPTTKRFIQHA